MSFPRYPKYKSSGVEWLDEVPEGWDVRRIKHLGKTITGGTPKTEEPEYWNDGDVPWLPSGKVQNGSICQADADTFITRRALAESAAKLIKPGSALIALTGATCANAAFLTFESTANQSVVGIEPKSNFNGRFIYYSLLAQREQVLTHKSGGAQGGINQEDVKNLVITAPESAEQTAIAEFLDRETGKIDGLVAEQRRLIELLKEKRQAVISHAVTKGLNPRAPTKPSGIEWLGDVPEHWVVTRLGFLCSKIGSGKTPLGGGDAYLTQGILFIRSQNVYDDGLHLDDVVYISEATDAEQSWSRVLSGDILLNITGASLGRTCLVPDDFQPANVNQHVCILRLARQPLRHFVSMVLKSSGMKSQFDAAQNGAAREGLNFAQISKLALAIPPEVEQAEIIKFLNSELAEADALTAEAQRAIDLLQERRTALISAAVTGQIDVRQQN